MQKKTEIAVIGAGVVGLSTALRIQQVFSNAKVTIFADKFDEDTLSIGAGGLYRPEENVHHDPERVRKWCKSSMRHFLGIIKSLDAASAGVQLVSGYQLSSSDVPLENLLLKETVPEYRHLTKSELKLFPQHFKQGIFFTTWIADCRYYLKWLQFRFEKNGGKIVKQHISNFSEVPDSFEVIVNCTGLGAKELLNDRMMMPVRGQTTKVKAPWIKHFYYGDEAYIVPGMDYITLGGIKDYGSSNMAVNPYQKQFIWDKCTELVPSLKNAEVLWDWVGLRPFRPSVRVDASFVKCAKGYRLLFNNYGHGGHGVSLSWGTAEDVVEMMEKMMQSNEVLVSKL